MKLAYVDPIGGASGDMILAALVDAGAPLAERRAGLAGLAVSGYTLEAGRAERGGVNAARIEVRLGSEPQPHRPLRDVEDVLARDGLALPDIDLVLTGAGGGGRTDTLYAAVVEAIRRGWLEA